MYIHQSEVPKKAYNLYGIHSSANEVLKAGLKKLGIYFRKWRLQANTKTNSRGTCFHLNNKFVKKDLRIHLENIWLTHNKIAKYLGVSPVQPSAGVIKSTPTQNAFQCISLPYLRRKSALTRAPPLQNNQISCTYYPIQEL